MKRTLILGAVALIACLILATASQAQVFVRAPFVRVGVGDGVYVRAPFVNLYIPGDGPGYPPPYGPRVIYMPPPGVVVQPQSVPAPQQFPPAPQPVQPAPKPQIKDDAPPQPVQPAQVPTLDSFAKTFQAKAGAYELALLNPITKTPTNVKFFLPEGTPRRVLVTRDSIEFIYGLRQWVRIEFDRDGATVTSR
jgi:hypothetical protein